MFVVALGLSATVLASPARAAGWFYPGPGPEIETIDADGRMGGVEVGLTGAVVLETEDPEGLASLPGVASVRPLRGGALHRVVAAPGVDEIVLSRTLRARPEIAWAHPDLILPLELHTLPDDPLVDEQWHLENTGQWDGTPGADIDAEWAWSRATGAGGLVAVLDSGVDTEHPDLDVINGTDFIADDDDSNPEPDDGAGPHGTAAAGLAAALGDNGVGVTGVAQHAQVYGIRFISDLGSSETSEFYDAFVEATDAGAWVISNSWGYQGCNAYSLPAVMRNGLRYAEENGRGGLGAAVVFSAGNDGCDTSEDGILKYHSVIGVAASDDDDDRESYSNWGDVVDISAPSGGVLTTDISGESGYGSFEDDEDYTGSFSGTSAAAPVVSGVLLLMFEANPRLTAEQAREALCLTAQPIDVENGEYDDDGWSPYYGCGRVDAGAAVAAVANTAPDAPEALGGEVDGEDPELRWLPVVDPDGESVRYEVDWTLGDDLDAEPVESDTADTGQQALEVYTAIVDEPVLDLDGEVALGDVVTWRVRALDAWGASADSEIVQTEVASPPRSIRVSTYVPAEAGCAESIAVVGLFGLFGWRRRRT